MYTLQFGSRAGFVDEANAETVLHAIREKERFVTVSVDIANDGGEPYEVTINVDHIVALIRHRPADSEPHAQAPALGDGSSRARLTVVS